MVESEKSRSQVASLRALPHPGLRCGGILGPERSAASHRSRGPWSVSRRSSRRSLSLLSSDQLKLQAEGEVVPYREVTLSAEVVVGSSRKQRPCRAGNFVRRGDLLIND